MKQLIDYIREAKEGKYAIGHFNVSDSTGLRAVIAGFIEASRLFKRETALLIGVSEGEQEFFGTKQIVALIGSYKEEGVPVFLNADHTRSLSRAMEAVRAGFDAVLFDAGKEPFEKDVQLTREAVAEMKSVNRAVLVEGELGFLGEGSKVFSAVPEGVDLAAGNLTTVKEALDFWEKTGIDLIAPAVGNIHGVIADKSGKFYSPPLDIGRISAIQEAVSAPVVLHGGSGIGGEELKEAVAAGAAIVHINTELRIAWKKGLEEAFLSEPVEIAPYKLLRRSEEAVKALVIEKLKLLNSVLY